MPRTKRKKELVLRSPDFIAAWPGVQNVALGAVQYVKDKHGAKRLMTIDPQEYFSPSGVYIQKGLVTTPSFPSNDFYYCLNPDGERDLLIFLSDGQPDFRSYEFANRIMDVAESLGVSSLYTAAAFASNEMRFSERPKIWGAATSPEMTGLLTQYEIPVMEKGQIAGMNGLILGVAKEREIPAACLLSEVPRFFPALGNPRASCLILEKLKQILELHLDLAELDNVASQVEAEVQRASKEAMGRYIQDFTVDYRDFFSED